LGVASSKVDTLSYYKVSLVIENCGNYMSEKLVDPILAGTITVYAGEPILSFEVPSDLVVVSEPNSHSIRLAIDKALTWDHDQYVLRAREWSQRRVIREQRESGSVLSALIAHIISQVGRNDNEMSPPS